MKEVKARAVNTIQLCPVFMLLFLFVVPALAHPFRRQPLSHSRHITLTTIVRPTLMILIPSHAVFVLSFYSSIYTRPAALIDAAPPRFCVCVCVCAPAYLLLFLLSLLSSPRYAHIALCAPISLLLALDSWLLLR